MPEPEIKALFTRTIAMDTDGRERFIAELKLSDPETAALLERLIEHDAEPLTDLDTPLEITSGLPTEIPIPSGHLGLPRQFGKYRLLRRVGAGGVGIVFEAEQEIPKRRVAIKVLHPWNSDQTASDRFRHEVHALGRLDHPDIARLYECAVADLGFGPQQYLAMEYVEGVSLTDYARLESLSIENKVRLLERVGHAVHSMHLKGIVHRDLKPSNVLVTKNGAPKLVDFGVASLQGAGLAPLTGTGQILGTPGYMSPEQMRGDWHDVDSRTDIYSLGLLAYEMLSGSLPKMDPAHCDPPPLLGSIDRRLRDDIEHVVAKALEPNPEDRYQSASAFAEDLGRALTGQALAARYGSIGAHAVRIWKHHRRRLVTSTAALVVVLTAAIAVPTSIYQRKLASAKTQHAICLSESFAEASGMIHLLRQDAPLELILETGAYDDLLVELKPYPEAWAQTASAIGLMIGMKGDLETAQSLLEESIIVAADTHDPKEYVLLTCMYRMVAFNSWRQQPEAGLPIAIDGYRRACKHYGSRSLMARQFAVQTADIYLRTHQIARSNEYATLALEDYQPNTGSAPRNMPVTRILGPILMRLDRLEEAEPIIRESIAWHRSIGFTKTRIYTWQVSSLASLQYKQGNMTEAERLFSEAANLALRTDGELSLQHISAIQSVGVCLREQGRLEEAEEFINRAMTLRRKKYAAAHPYLANSLVTLANLYQLMPGVTPERIEIAREGLAMRQTLDVSSQEIAEAELALGSLLLKHGEIQAAAEMVIQAESRYTATASESWRKQYARALVLVDQILDHPETAETGGELQATYSSLLSIKGENDPWVREINRWRAELGMGSFDFISTTD